MMADPQASEEYDSDDFNEGFILPPLIVQLKKILEQYPDDSQILKELIQNAEDAGARQVKFLVDHHSHGTDPKLLHHPGLAKFQGPALYAFNDGLFDEDDWKGIRMLSQSVKQSDPLKVGYFGMGFKSVFHITDLPIIFSGSKIGVIDPHQKYFPASTHSWNVSKRTDLLESLPHQFQPLLGIFGCNRTHFKQGHFDGSLFRFPIRRSASALAEVPCTVEKIRGLFECFQDDAHLLLMFLKHLETIELYEREATAKEPRLVFRVSLSDDCIDEVRQKRVEFLNQTRACFLMQNALISTYPLGTETTLYTPRKEEKTERHRWLVTNYFCGGKVSAIFRKLHRDTELNYPPWVGAAMPLDLPQSEDGNVFELTDEDGHVFCFLPLPLEQKTPTGLPVHVNGFFALEQNRKYIKWPSGYHARQDFLDKRLLWNQCMLKEALPKAYAELLLAAIERYNSGSGTNIGLTLDTIYRAFPDFGKVDKKWEVILPIMFSELFKNPVVFTPAAGGRWIMPRSAVFNTLSTEEAAKEVILEVLEAGEVKVATIPEHVLKAIKGCCHINLATVTQSVVAQTYKSVQFSHSLQWDEKLALLKYMLKHNKYDLLEGLELLPLANGGFTAFFYNPRRADRLIYITTDEHPATLLPGLDDDVLDQEVDADVKDKLVYAAMRGFTQLKLLDETQLSGLLPGCMPATWLDASQVTWDPTEYGHPPETWLETLWAYLAKHCRDDLTPFESLPILPISTSGQKTELAPLSSASPLVAKHMDGLSMPERLDSILGSIGIFVIQDVPEYVQAHPLVNKHYVYSPSYMGVLKALHKLTLSDGVKTVCGRLLESTTADEKRTLSAVLSKVSSYELIGEHRQLMQQLPLFETLDKSGGKESHFTSCKQVCTAAPLETLPVHVSKFLLDISSQASAALGSLLGLTQLNMTTLLTGIVFADIENAYYETEDVESIMLYVLRHYHSLVEVDSSFRDTLKGLPFLPRKDMLVTVDRFYDPDHELLQKLFLGEENFPTGSYAEPGSIAILREIGLRGLLDVEPEDIEETAYMIQDMLSGSDMPLEKVVTKSGALMLYLQQNESKLTEDCQGQPLYKCIRDIKWMRCLGQKPSIYPEALAWYQAEDLFDRPCNGTSKQYGNIIGSVKAVVAADETQVMSQLFGWDDIPPVESIVKHFANTIRSYNGTEKAKYVEIIQDIYKQLSKHPADKILALLHKEEVTDWVWTGDGFTNQQSIVFEPPFMDLRPFIYAMPSDMTTFCPFFTDCGVKKRCNLSDVLLTIKTKYESGKLSISATDDKRDLRICISILNELKSTVTAETLPALQAELVLPLMPNNRQQVQHLITFAPLAECTYCDKEWLKQGHDLGEYEEEEKLLFVHPNLPNSTSVALGVPTLMSRMLDAEELDFSFGQTDSLTHRLNVLLQEYTDGFAVPKELVQNADDAGATEVKILYDERQNREARTCLLDEGMKECQGPAIWAYNDAVFTDNDFENITKLCGATKECQTDKIGRFGLGFNAVYNLTDVPSFVSRNNIAIFDPHTTHLGKSIKNKARPGIKIDMKKHRKRLRRLGNQFQPYNDVFGCDLRAESTHESYNATLFRFPLRTRAQAVKSEICQRHYDDKEVKLLLHKMMKGAETLVLFTQNVINVSIYHIPSTAADPSDMREIFSVSKRPLSILRYLKFPEELPETAKDYPPEVKTFIGQCNILKASTAALRQIRDGTDVSKVETPNCSLVMEMTRHVTRDGERLIKLKNEQEVQQWLVSSHMGRGESLNMALQENYLLPTGAVAVQLMKVNVGYVPKPILNPDTNKHHGIVFTYLPLPIRTGLPVHINAAFAVTSNRRYLCERNEDDKFDMRAIWNEALLEDAVCKSYINMLADLASLAPAGLYEYYMTWPRPDTVESNSKPLLQSFYRSLTDSESNATLFSSRDHRWVSMAQSVFLGSDLQNSSVEYTALDVFTACQDETNCAVVSMDDWVRTGFWNAGRETYLKDKSFDTVRFFQSIFLPNITKFERDQRDDLMIYALKQDLPELNDVLMEYGCVPVTPAGTELMKPGRIVDPHSTLAMLYSPEDGRFPYGSELYAKKPILKVLLKLGMATEEMEWGDIVERAQSVRSVDREAGRKRTTGLLAILEQKLAKVITDDTDMETCREQLMQTSFLPTMSRPATFPLDWKGDEMGTEAVFKPAELYPSEMWPLVSCVQPVVDEQVLPKNADRVKALLGFKNKKASMITVMDQLTVISNLETEKYLQDRDISNELQRACYDIYMYLQGLHMAYVPPPSDEEEADPENEVEKHLFKRLNTEACILCHNRFLSPRQLAFNFSHNCDPYLFGVPEVLKRNLKEFLKVVGVKERFDSKDYVFALQNMHSVYDSDPLDKQSLKLALHMVNLLNDSMADLDQTLTGIVEEHGTIYIPDANNVLASASELCFNEPDCQWVPTPEFTNYSHPLIPFTISKQLGVNTRRQEVLKKHSKGIAFGQRERLTVRLKRILSGYPFDKEILKEMLQNADDAEASEIHFINDPRRHPSERVFDDVWKPLQGPALCVYNDKPFSKSDLEGIQRLGEGSKSTDPNKTGQYGVGFNCVYHLTDAPSFLTGSPDRGETLCVFDPHAKYVPGASVEEPGRRYDEVAELRQIFTDVFPCYLEEQYDLSNATMFRFPLRDAKMAATSEVSDRVVDSELLDSLLTKFKPELFDCLLFMKHVNSITITEVHKLTNRLTSTYTVTSEITDSDRQAREEFADYVKKYSLKVQNGEVNAWEIPPMDVSYTMTLSDNKDYWEKWLVTQRIGFDSDTTVPGVVTEAFKRQDLALLPIGGVAALLHTADSDVLNRPRRAFCFLPLPIKLDLPVNVNGHFALDHEARRNLWYDEDAGPKTEWNRLILQKIIASAYVTMLKRAPSFLGTSFVNPNLSLMEIFDDEIPSIDVYGTLFPAPRSTESYQVALVEGIYQHIHSSQEPVLPVVRVPGASFMLSRSLVSMAEAAGQAEIEWLSTSGLGCDKPYFDNLDETFFEQDAMDMSLSLRRKNLTSTPKKKARCDTLREVLLSSGFKLVKLPLEVYKGFQAADVPVECISPFVVVDFFKHFAEDDSSCALGALPVSITDTPFHDGATLKNVLEYCLQDPDSFFENLNGLPLLLCEDEQLRVFTSAKPVYVTTYYDLIPECSAMFMHHLMVNKVFKGVNVDDIPVMQRLDVQALASLIVNAVPRVFHTAVRHVPWKPDEEGVRPSPQWIWNLWNFLREEYERLLADQLDSVDERKLANSILKPLCKWCLLPAFVHNSAQAPSANFYYSTGEAEAREHFLVPVGLANTVLDFNQAGVMSYPMRDCLRRLEMPELAKTLIDGGLSSPVGKANVSTASNSNFARLLVATLERPNSTLSALKHAVSAGVLKDGIRPEECLLILKFFNDCVESWKEDHAAQRLLKNIPVFQGINGNMVSMGDNTAYVLPREIPNADMAAWEKQAGICFLRFTPGLEDLYKTLHCTSLSVTEVYTRFVFGNFATLGSTAKIAHLSFIKDSQLPLLKGEVRDSCLEALKSLEFLKAADGSLKKASDFYDPYHPVFKMMLGGPLAKESFPPSPFDEFVWLEFMRLIGLQHNVSVEQFISFARQVEAEAQDNPSEAAFDKARTLVTHLFKRAKLATEGLLEQIKDIRFVPAAKVNSMLQKISQAYGSGTSRPFIAFREGVAESHELLVWSSGYMIPDWANPYKLAENNVSFEYSAEDRLSKFENYQKTIASILGIDSDPPVEKVIEHTQNVCDNVFTKINPTDEVKAFMKVDVMKRVYKFLQEKYLDCPLLRESLEDVSCIVVDLGYTFVRPKQVVINLYEEDQIMPYLYKAPTELGEFKDLFLQLGVTLNATVDQYVWILESLYMETNGEKLHPNELRIAFKAVYELFTILQKHPKEVVKSQMLFLPSATGHLIMSTDLVFNNDPTYTDRIKHFTQPFLVDLAECYLSVANFEDLIKLLPPKLQPAMLTDLVQEVLEEESRKTVVSYGIAEKLRHQLNSRAFSIGVVRLIRHEHHRLGQRVQQRVLDTIQDQLKTIRVFGAEKVMTYLTYEGVRIPGSETQTQCFVDKTYDYIQRQNIWSIYIDNSVSMNEELLVSVAEVVNRIVGGMLKNSVHYLQPILSFPPHSISSVLDRLKIRQDHSVDFKQPTLPNPGTFIPLDDHHLLKEDFEEFEAGEYVALELEDDISGGQTFIYAIIIGKYEDHAYDSGLFLTRYKINVGDERKPSLAIVTDLYKFHRVEGFVSRNTSTAEKSPATPLTPKTPVTPQGGSASFTEHEEVVQEEEQGAEEEEEEEERERPVPISQKSIFERYSDIIKGQDEDDEDDESFSDEVHIRTANGDFVPHDQYAKGEDEGTSNGFGEKGHERKEVSSELAEAGTGGEDLPKGKKFPRKKEKTAEKEEPKAAEEAQAPPKQPTIPEMDEGKTLQELMEAVSDTLEEAWELPENQRKKVIKRVLLKWHPDKNIGNEQLATVITQHIGAELERIESGMPRPSKFDEFDFQLDPRNPFSTNENFKKNFYNAYQFFFDQVNKRAKEHREQRQRYRENFSKEYSSGKGEYNFDVPPSFTNVNPQPAQAKRFLRQAQEDLRAADNDYEAREPAYEWVCFKAHQAAEKSLKAAQFAVDAATSFSHDLTSLAALVDDMELRRLAIRLQTIIGNSSRLYNPDPIDFVVIPHEEFTKDMACDATMCSADILERAKEFVETKEYT